MNWFRRLRRKTEETELLEPEVLQARLDAALQLPALAESRALLLRLAEDYTRTLALAERPLRLALVGSTGAGKSTLLNALAGTLLAREGIDRPTSTEAVAYAPVDADLGALAEVVPRIIRYVPDPAGGWSGQVFVDTPDLNSVAQSHAAIALAVLEHVDAVLLVLHRGSVAEARPADALRPFARRRALLCVLNFADQLGPEARQALRAQVTRVAQGELGAEEAPPVYVVSALRARLGEANEEDWPRLLESLQRLADEDVATELRRRNARAALGQLQQRLARALEETETTRSEVQAALTRGLDQTQRLLEEDFRLRLEAASAHLRQTVRRQAAARLSGPIGWGLRLSGWGSGGLAGAALAAQASIPAGLLVAATGAVLDEVQSRSRDAAAERAVLSTADGALDNLGRQSLGPARTAAAAHGLAPELLGLPTHPAWVATLAGTRALAWREVEGAVLADAVARWWQWARLLLMPLVQLPLLALVLHVGYRVARAYWEGGWLPAGYFINAAVLAGAWTVAGTLVAALTLSGVAAGLRRAGQVAFSRALEAAFSDVRASAEAALRGPRDAARQLLAESPR